VYVTGYSNKKREKNARKKDNVLLAEELEGDKLGKNKKIYIPHPVFIVV
jgi:hypothetical protein